MRWRVSSGVSGVVAVVVGGTEGLGMERSTCRSEDCLAAEVSLSSASATASASDAGGSERLGSDDSVGAPSAASSSSSATDDTLLRTGKRRPLLLLAFGWRLGTVIGVAIVINMVLVYLVLRNLGRLERFLGEGGIAVLQKVFGIILLAIAVKLFTSNIQHLF